ncbi:hypothetical protein PGT21_010333 [Puccinia graminis f. sp. tritici]|uniref:Uncharacterized protein n=1 Tax=Puccinia graminis f. sp. tritici TaxID=56615 RepID=A0A5B0MLI6_PUCGR|nr:hypothetical protein PGT21_010333 [Puccinia graminis f. sp. tritici]
MSPREKNTPAANDQRTTSLELLKESYRALEKFHQATTAKAKSLCPNQYAGAHDLTVFQQLLEHFKTVIDHQAGNQKDEAQLVEQCTRIFVMLTNYLFCSAIPIKKIFSAIKPAVPVRSSPILGLMSYIYEAKLGQCQAPFSPVQETRFKENSEHIGQCWERILAAFGD